MRQSSGCSELQYILLSGRRKFTLVLALVVMLLLLSTWILNRQQIYTTPLTAAYDSEFKSKNTYQDFWRSDLFGLDSKSKEIKEEGIIGTESVEKKPNSVATKDPTLTIQSSSERFVVGEATTPEWMQDRLSVNNVDEHSLRCKGTYHGCFTTEISIMAQLTGREDHLSKNECLQKCEKLPNVYYAALTIHGQCFCIDMVDTFLASKVCDVACSALKSNNCKALNSVRIWGEIECYSDMRQVELDKATIGFVDLKQIEAAALAKLTMPNLTPAQCILNCERRNFTLAATIWEFNTCVCTDSISLFKTAENMKEILSVGPDDLHTVTLYKTLAKDPFCSPKKFLYPLYPIKTVLASYPGSGNTWIRHLIEEATGIYTGSFYNDAKLRRGGFIGEAARNPTINTIAVKNHFTKRDNNGKYTRAILLMRNLYNATIADYSRFRSHNHIATIDPQEYRSPEFDAFTTKRLPEWHRCTEVVFKEIPPENVLVLFYENVKENPVREMRKVVRFLSKFAINPSKEALERRLMCMQMNIAGQFKRGNKHLTFDPFDTEKRKAFDEEMRKFSVLVKKVYGGNLTLPDSYIV